MGDLVPLKKKFGHPVNVMVKLLITCVFSKKGPMHQSALFLPNQLIDLFIFHIFCFEVLYQSKSVHLL